MYVSVQQVFAADRGGRIFYISKDQTGDDVEEIQKSLFWVFVNQSWSDTDDTR
jgi:hypothetical protein